MFLKSLDIFGFKSFADHTHIQFADGITALLGPNGCGKSNVVDAIKWVLAENKSKNLRAVNMGDVIFNGTKTRPALSMAEVTLTIANENKILQRDEEEIAIKRRLFRSGENEYFINGTQVTATEIRKLFMDTGVGKAAYSVMEQGKIYQILNSKPEDRRYLFEEAAGISRSKAQVIEAERELEKTRENLKQIEQTMAETKRNYEVLKLQSEKTLEYRKLKDLRLDYERDIQLLRLKDFTQNKARSEQARKEAEEKRDAAVKEIEEIYETLNENTDKIKTLQEQVNTKQKEAIALASDQAGKKALAKQFREQQSSIKEKIAQAENRIKTIKERIDEYNEDIDNHNADLHDKNKSLEDINKNIEGFTTNIRQCSGQIDENQKQISTNSGKIHNLDRDRATLQKALQDITEDIVTELDAKLKDAGYSSIANKKAKEELFTSLEKIKIFASGRENIFKDFSSLPNHSEKDTVQFTQDALSAMQELKQMLDALKENLDSYAKTTPEFIDDFLSPEGIITKKREIDDSIENNLKQIENLNLENKTLSDKNVELTKRINEYRDTLGKLQINRAEMVQQINALQQQILSIKKTLKSEETALSEHQNELFEEKQRGEDMQEKLEEIEEQIADLQLRGVRITKELKELDAQIEDCNSKVSGKQNALQKKQDEKTKYQAQLERLTITIAQNDTEIRNVKQNFQDNYSRDLMEFEERMYTITESPEALRKVLAETKQKIADLGQVNHMAVEQFAEEKDRYERQQESYNDTKATLEKLTRVSEEIRSKSAELFFATYNKIRKNFHNMFRKLFGGAGGNADLKLTNPEDVLTTGIEIYAQPPGKKLENISLLSGGEKTMTAVALLFATYQVRPSPFCLLDEIDAALDNKNVSSFVNTLRSFANISQYIVITHNSKTAMGAYTMIGVTMEESGVTKVLQLQKDRNTLNATLDYNEDTDFVEEDVPPEEGVVLPPRPTKREHKTQENAISTVDENANSVKNETIETMENSIEENGEAE